MNDIHGFRMNLKIEELEKPKTQMRMNECFEYLIERIKVAESFAKVMRDEVALLRTEKQNMGSVDPDAYLDEIQKIKLPWE